jgi:hypothetical protein
MHCSIAGPHHSKKIHGSDSEIQPVQDEACQLFEEIEGVEIDQVVTAVEKCLEGLMNEAVIQEFTEEEALVKHQVEAARAKLKEFEAELPRLE